MATLTGHTTRNDPLDKKSWQQQTNLGSHDVNSQILLCYEYTAIKQIALHY